MSEWGGNCRRCGEKKKLLFSSWYCPCEDDSFALIGYGLISSSVYKDMGEPNELPKTFCLHLFKDKSVAQKFNSAYIGFTLLRVDLSDENQILWSTKEKLWIHEASRNLPCKVVQ